MLAGEVDHKDTIGNAGTIGPGDVQWMTPAAASCTKRCRDRATAAWRLSALGQHAGQAQDVAAALSGVADAEIPVVQRPTARACASWPVAATACEGRSRDLRRPEYLDVELAAGADFVQPIPRGHAAFAYVFRGEGEFGVAGDLGYRGELDGSLVRAPGLIVFDDGDEVRVRANDEPVASCSSRARRWASPSLATGVCHEHARRVAAALADLQAGTFVWSEARGG